MSTRKDEYIVEPSSGGGGSSILEQVEQANPVSTLSEAPPNGGLMAWLQVAGAFCIFFNTWYVWFNPTCCTVFHLTSGDPKQGDSQHVRGISDLLPC